MTGRLRFLWAGLLAAVAMATASIATPAILAGLALIPVD
jgi:hypothetical protein